MTGTPERGNADLLTRTTLQIEKGEPMIDVGAIVHALRRVPGVLLAEMDPTTGRAVVAHDSGVATASLLAAATSAGARARLMADAPSAGASLRRTVNPYSTVAGRVAILAVAGAVVVASVGAANPGLAKAAFLLLALISCAGAFALGHAAFGRRM